MENRGTICTPRSEVPKARRILLQICVITDCSQTLYEFRASNPKALNVLEGSGVFSTHKLETNYRSNQEILDFANILLGNIEANQYANIQLKANSLARVTAQSFQEKVKVAAVRMPNKNAQTMDNMIGHSIAVENRAFIQDKLDRGEQLAILAHKRNTLGQILAHLKKVFPNAKIASITPKKNKPSTIISKFIATEWDNITYTPPASIMLTIRRALYSSIKPLSGSQSAQAQATTIRKIAADLMDAFEKENKTIIQNWQTQVANSVMPVADMLAEIRKLLITFEIRRNAVSQSITSSRNNTTRESDEVKNANILMSTIHSAKGLEFPHTLVYCEDTPNIDEPDKRMYYVAFTRAQKSEQIFVFGTRVHSNVQSDYETVVKTLEAKDALWAAQQATNAADPDDPGPAAVGSADENPAGHANGAEDGPEPDRDDANPDIACPVAVDTAPDGPDPSAGDPA